MTRRKIGEDAFSYYFSLGPARSYEVVAQKYDCSKRAVAKVASKESWQTRLDELEEKARTRSDQQILESLEQMNSRHIKTARMLQAKGIEALQGLQLKAVPDALKALQIGLEKERLIRGEPSERRTVDIIEIIRAEYAELMVDEETVEERALPPARL